jgi:hypothetical protein
VEAIKDFVSGINKRPPLINNLYQISHDKKEEKNDNQYLENFENTINKLLPINIDKEQNKINIIMIQPEFNQNKVFFRYSAL